MSFALWLIVSRVPPCSTTFSNKKNWIGFNFLWWVLFLLIGFGIESCHYRFWWHVIPFPIKRVFFCFTIKMDLWSWLKIFNPCNGEMIVLGALLRIELFIFYCWECGFRMLLYPPFRFIRNFNLYLACCACALALLWSLIDFRALFYVWHFADLKS